MTIIRRTAGITGPAVFSAAAFVAARLQPGYSHRAHHVSGLAAAGERSAFVMVPGFLALGAATFAMPVNDRVPAVVAKVAGAGVIVAGLIPASQPRCPQPGIDPEANALDVGHGIASVVTFVSWTALPFVSSTSAGSAWYLAVNRVLHCVTPVGFAGAALTTRFDAPIKGVAQRAFLASVFAWYIATAIRVSRSG